MFNESIINLEKEDYIDYLICVCGHTREHAENLANMMYN
jgi:hypothetical protein